LRFFATRYDELQLGIQTRGNVYWDDGGVDPACTNYQAADYGSLKGRVLAVATTHLSSS